MAKDTKMEEPKKIEVLKTQDMKPKQKLLNIETGVEEDVEIRYQIVSVNPEAKDQPDNVLKELHKLVQPKDAQIKAFVEYLNRQSYQDGKESAVSSGKYMTSQLRSQITSIMKNLEAFADVSASDCFARWLDGYKAKKPAALKLLETARASLREDELSEGL